MELRQLAVFVAVAEERSFSRAADRLHVVQSAVSATIRALEREWGLTLFDRSTHHVALSAEGEAMLVHARAALAAAEDVGHAVDEVRGGLRGTLHIGVMQATRQPGGISVAAAISAFSAQYPDVRIVVRQSGSAEQVAAVRAGELDLAFVGLPPQALHGVATQTLVEPEMTLAVSSAHRLAGRRSVDLAEVVDEPWADLPPTWGLRVATDHAFAAAGLHREIRYEINDIATTVDFVRHGLAVALLALVWSPPGDGVVFVPLRRHTPRFTISLIWPQDRPVGPAARRFLEVAATAAV